MTIMHIKYIFFSVHCICTSN